MAMSFRGMKLMTSSVMEVINYAFQSYPIQDIFLLKKVHAFIFICFKYCIKHEEKKYLNSQFLMIPAKKQRLKWLHKISNSIIRLNCFLFFFFFFNFDFSKYLNLKIIKSKNVYLVYKNKTHFFRFLSIFKQILANYSKFRP